MRQERSVLLWPPIKKLGLAFFWLLGFLRVCGFRLLVQRERDDCESPAETLVPKARAISQSTTLRLEGYPSLKVRQLRHAEFSNSETDRRLNAISYNSGLQHVLDVPPLSPPPPAWPVYLGSATSAQLGLIAQRRRTLLSHRRPHRIAEGILITGPTHNFFHWLLECLPSIFLVEKSKSIPANFPFLIPGGYLAHENSVNLLELFAGNRPVVNLDSGKWYRAKSIFLVEGPTIPGTMQPNSFFAKKTSDTQQVRPDVTDGYHAQFMTEYRSELIRRLASPSLDGPTRIYLARKKTARREFNRPEIENILEKKGFVKLFPQDFSIREVAGLMAGAKVVVGPQGAQWANTIFCSSEMRAVQFNESMLSASFLNLAELVGYDLSFVFDDASKSASGQTIAENVAHSTRKNFSIDVRVFAEKVEQLCAPG